MQIIWEGKAKWHEIMSMFPTELAAKFQHLERQSNQEAPKRYSVPELKDCQYLQIIWEGKAKWQEIMSMFPTELAAESNT